LVLKRLHLVSNYNGDSGNSIKFPVVPFSTLFLWRQKNYHHRHPCWKQNGLLWKEIGKKHIQSGRANKTNHQRMVVGTRWRKCILGDDFLGLTAGLFVDWGHNITSINIDMMTIAWLFATVRVAAVFLGVQK